MALADDLTLALRSAPELATAPSIAMTVASDPTSTDVAGNAQAVAQAGNQNNIQTAADNVNAKANHPGFFGHVLGLAARGVNDVANAPVIGKALNTLGTGLREVQHQYRYFHDVEARHGPIAALAAITPVLAATAAGAYYGESTQAAELAGETVGGLEARLVYKDSWERTADGANYQGTFNRQTGQYEGPAGTVSLGRDVAGALGLKPGSKPYTVSSAALDGIADLGLDPLAVAGKAYAGAKSAEGLGAVTRFSQAPQGETLALRASDLENRVAQLPAVKRALTEIAGMNAGQIVNNYPKFEGIAAQLGRADTFDKVVDVFRNQLMAKELASNTDRKSVV